MTQHHVWDDQIYHRKAQPKHWFLIRTLVKTYRVWFSSANKAKINLRIVSWLLITNQVFEVSSHHNLEKKRMRNSFVTRFRQSKWKASRPNPLRWQQNMKWSFHVDLKGLDYTWSQWIGGTPNRGHTQVWRGCFVFLHEDKALLFFLPFLRRTLFVSCLL